MKKIYATLIVLIIFLLNGCGGGSGSGGSTGTNNTVTANCPNGTSKNAATQDAANLLCDATKLLTISPANNANDISADTFAGVTVTTDSTLDAKSITTDNIKLSASGVNVPGAVTMVGTNGFKFTPTTKLNYVQAYSFTASVKDTFGKSFTQTISFLTVPISCVSSQTPNNSGTSCESPLLASYPTLLPDIKPMMETLCGKGKVANIQNGLAVDLTGHKDGRKDLLFTLWCGMSGVSGISITTPTINGTVAYIQNQEGIFRDGTKELFGVDFLDIGGISHYAAAGDFNKDGYDDVVFSVSREDGRDWSIDHALNGIAPAFLTSNGIGKYTLEKKGKPEWGYGTMKIDNEFDGEDVLVGGEVYDVWRFTDSWKIIDNYSWATPRTYFFKRSNPGVASKTAVIGENSGKQINLYNRNKDNLWVYSSSYSVATNNPPIATWIGWNGQVGQQTITRIEDEDYTAIYFDAICELRPTKNSELIAVSVFTGYKIDGGFNGQVLTEGKGMTSTTKLVGFSINQGNIKKIPMVVRNEANENIAMFGSGLKCGDVNGDGYDDIVMYTSGQKPLIYLNDGGGAFDRVNPTNFPDISNLGAVVNVYEDIDGDGVPDLLYFAAAGVNNSQKIQFPIYKGLRKIVASDRQ
jgi:hypothetical protein